MATGDRSNRGPAAAAENREAIIIAAGEIFAEQGLEAPLNAIAKRAGVGQGSLYRHFPTRQSLAYAAFEGNLSMIEDIVAGGGTLADVLAEVSAQAARSAAFIALINRNVGGPQSDRLESRIRSILAATIDQGRSSGTVPEGFTVDDLMLCLALMSGALGTVAVEDRPALIEKAWRLLGIRLS